MADHLEWSPGKGCNPQSLYLFLYRRVRLCKRYLNDYSNNDLLTNIFSTDNSTFHCKM